MHPGGMTIKEDDRAAGTRSNRSLIATGAIGALLAAICCATPLLAVLLGAIGLSTWLAKADYVLIPALLLSLALLGLGLYRRRLRRA
jgi:mercuric ion transport protein